MGVSPPCHRRAWFVAIEQTPVGNRTATTWNFENQPTQYLLPSGGRVTMMYNGDSRRVQIQEPSNDYNDLLVWDPVSDCVFSELDGTNAVQVVYTKEPQQYGGVLSQPRGTIISTLLADALGTTRVPTTSTQTNTDSFSTTPGVT